MPLKDKKLLSEYNRAYHRKWYMEHSEDRIKDSCARKIAIRDWLREYKSSLKCIMCQENHPACLEFHHRNRLEKVDNVASASNKGWSISRIKEEISKCDVLCANCHRKAHWGIV